MKADSSAFPFFNHELEVHDSRALEWVFDIRVIT
nr:MAG TPA: hypothetical protein [Caudoviricetes sp.]